MTRSCLAFIAVSLLISSPALAYVGPGPGLTMIGSLIGLVGSVVLAVVMVLAWPLRMYFKKKKARKAANGTAPSDTPPAP